jgi:hypothetical protein
MADAIKPNGQLRLTVTWPNLSEVPVMGANAFMLQHTGQEFVLNVGFAAAPFLARPEDAANLKSVEAKTIARFSMSPARVIELIQMFQQALSQMQPTQKH